VFGKNEGEGTIRETLATEGTENAEIKEKQHNTPQITQISQDKKRNFSID
jgi:hypothetical protein